MEQKKEERYNELDIRLCYRFLNHLNESEIRIIDPLKKESPQSIFIHSEDEFVNTCRKYNGKYNLYVGINEREKEGTHGNEVISVKTIVIDIDAIREKGFEKEPATEKELEKAKEIVDKILIEIKKTKQAPPVVLNSGNGYQLWFAIPEIKIDNFNRKELEDKLQIFQDQVKEKFDVDNAIDKIGDLPRIIKIWGTLNIKSITGNETIERPFRIAKIVGNKNYRDEDNELKEIILNLKRQKTPEYDIEEINEIELDKLPPCLNQLIKFYENKDGNHWMRIIQFMASFFASIGLDINKTKDIVYKWNKKQPYHENKEEEDIERTINRIYKNKINCPNCEKIKKESGGFPFFGLSELKICKPDSKCSKCINPIIRYKRATEKDTGKITEATGIFLDKRELAKRFLKVQPLFYDKGKLWWIWLPNKYKWEIIDETDVLNAIEKNHQVDTIDSTEKNEILEALRQEGRKNIPEEIKTTWIQFQDTIIDIQTGEKFQASEKYFVTNPIQYKISENSDTPVMDRIFEEWVGKDYIKTLYEIIAYCCLCDYPINRLFCFIGAGMNGKSCFLNLLRKFIGTTNVCSTELDLLLTSRFEVTKLHKKLVCMMGETNFNEIKNTSILKRLTGGDLIGFEYKNKNPFEDKNYAKIIIATNNLPTTDDKTMGFYRRWMIIDFPNSFTEKKDILCDIPEEEYENLAAKCVLLLTDLLKIREFTNEGNVEERMIKFEEKSNPISKFIKDCCILEDPNNFITSSQFEKRFNEWAKEHRYREFSSHSIAEQLKKYGLEHGRDYIDWWDNGKLTKKQAKGWFGIRWK